MTAEAIILAILPTVVSLWAGSWAMKAAKQTEKLVEIEVRIGKLETAMEMHLAKHP